MRVKLVSKDDAVTSVAAAGEITQSAFVTEDEPLALAFGEQIYSSRLLLGLSEAVYVDSRGVGWLLKCHKRCREAGGVLVIHSIPPFVSDVLRVLRLNKVLDLADDEEQARAVATAASHE
jgi:anti-anti-sigma factor